MMQEVMTYTTNEPMYTIYIIRNTVNKKEYIGQTNNVAVRWDDHIWELNTGRHHNQHLQRAWNKYGAESFEFSVWDTADTEEEINVKEAIYIDLLGTLDRDIGYNLRGGGNNGKMSEESKRKLSDAKKGKPGTPHTEETRQKISRSNKRGMKGRHHTKEARQKLSEAHKGLRHTDEAKRKIREAKTGKPRSEATKAKMSKAFSKAYAGMVSPDGQVFASITQLKAWCSEYGLDHSNVHRVLTGKQRAYKGWTLYEPEG